MTIQAHLAEIERRHHVNCRGTEVDDLELVGLKRQKLHLRDEIERLRHDQKS